MSKFRKWESILLVAVFGVAYIFWFYPTFATTPAEYQQRMALAKSKNCLSCHQIDKKLVGPSWKDVAAKGDSIDVLANSIKNGVSGKWGPIPMPPNQVTEEEALSLAVFIKGL